MKTVNIKWKNVFIYDNGGKTFDRYTAVYKDCPERAPNTYSCVGMSERPFSPQGYGQHNCAMLGRHLGKKIAFNELNEDCQKLVMRDLLEIYKEQK